MPQYWPTPCIPEIRLSPKHNKKETGKRRLFCVALYSPYSLYGRFLDEKSVDPYTDAPYLEAVLRIL